VAQAIFFHSIYHIKLAIFHIPFSLIQRSRYLTSMAPLISAYRETPFTVRDGLSEWKDGFMCIAVKDNSLAGLMCLTEKRTCWGLSSFVVDSKFRGQGIGSSMLESLDLDKPIYLKVKQDNPAISLYEKHNYTILEAKSGRYHMKKRN